MEASPSLVVMALAAAVLLYYVANVVHWVWWKPKALEKELRRQGIRGNPYRLLYGDIKEDAQLLNEAWSRPMELTHRIAPRVFPSAHRTAQRYGKIALTWAGTTPRIIIWDPEMIRQILSGKFGHFRKAPSNPLLKVLVTGVAGLEGEEWAKRRRLISPAFHLEKLKGMLPAFRTSCIDMIERWEKLAGIEGSCELDVCPEFQTLTGDVISRTAFGSSFEEGKRIFQLQKEQSILAIEASRDLYLPGFRFLPTMKNKRRMHIYRETKFLLKNMIDKKLESIKMGKSIGDDLLSLMLQSTNLNNLEEKRTNGKQYEITVEEVIEECKLFYLAGQETTSVWLTWTLILLSMHQVWQQRAREEVIEICKRSPPDFEAISRLKIIPMILYEVLRLYPSVIALVRRTYKKMTVGKFTFPSGVDFLLPIILLHHDQEYWGEDAEEFNPERFSEGVSKASKGQNAFLPFGWGPRICLGMNFATIEAKMALAMILQHFSFELSPSYAHAPYTVVTLQPQLGAHIILHKI